MSWSASGRVTAIGLNTADEREYRIQGSDPVMSRLMGCLRQRVGVTGEVVGDRSIRVQSFEVLEPAE